MLPKAGKGKLPDYGFRDSGLGFEVSGFWFWVERIITTTVHTMLRHTAACPYACGVGKDLGFGVWGLGFRVGALEFWVRVSSLGLRSSGFGSGDLKSGV